MMPAKTDKRGWFDTDAFHSALDSSRRAKNLNWKEVAAQSGVSASTLTRMAQGKRPDVDGLAALCTWSGLRADDFMKTDQKRAAVEPLAAISTLLRSDKNLSPESATRLSEIIKVSYKQLKDLKDS